jgi:hypothetical protein
MRRPRAALLPLPAALTALALILLLWPRAAEAEGRIRQLSVTREGDAVSVSAFLATGFPEHIAEQIKSGVPKDLFYTVSLRRRHRRWFDEELASRTVQYTIKFDTLEGRYHIRRIDPDGSGTEVVVPTYAAAVDLVSWIRGVTLPLPTEEKGAGHYVSVKAEMRAVRLPLYLDYVFFFIPILEFETPWARSPMLESLP